MARSRTRKIILLSVSALALMTLLMAFGIYLVVRGSPIGEEVALQLSALGIGRDYEHICEITRKHAAGGDLSARQRVWADDVRAESLSLATRRTLAAIAYADPGERYPLFKAGGNISDLYGIAKAAGFEMKDVPKTWECPEMQEWLAGIPVDLLKSSFPRPD